MKEKNDEAIRVVEERHPESAECHIINVFEEFLGGSLIIVGFKTPPSDVLQENFVFFKNGKTQLYRYTYEMLQSLSTRETAFSIMVRNLSSNAISGIIAIMLTSSIIYLAISKTAIPDILVNGLTVILGFYFGSAVSKRNGKLKVE